MLNLLPQTLLSVVSKFPSLTSLSFRKITLEDASAATHVMSIWSDFLLELADCVKCQDARTLASLSISDPTCKHLHCLSDTPVYFATQPNIVRTCQNPCCRGLMHVCLNRVFTRSPCSCCFIYMRTEYRNVSRLHPPVYTRRHSRSLFVVRSLRHSAACCIVTLGRV